MTIITSEFTFLTPAFPHGAYQSQNFNRPELRGPSVRGQLRWWYDALFGDRRAEDEIFGSIKGQRLAQASRISVRVWEKNRSMPVTQDILPHKPADERGPKLAIAPRSGYEMSVQPRRDGLSTGQMDKLIRAVDAWLLLGGVGQRANRAAGSLWPSNPPADPASFQKTANELIRGSRLRFALLDRNFGANHVALRILAGDILHGPTEILKKGGKDIEVTQKWWPFGSGDEREPSPLKLKAVEFNGQLRLLALWDGRQHPSSDLARGVEYHLKNRPGHELAQLLAAVLPLLK